MECHITVLEKKPETVVDAGQLVYEAEKTGIPTTGER